MKILEITENDANQRLDKFVKKIFPNATRSLIYKLNRKGKIKILNNIEEGYKKRDNEYKLKINDKIKIFISDNEYEQLNIVPQKINFIKNTNGITKKDIVYEDGDLLVINKSPGINVHPGDHKTKEISLIGQIHDYFLGKLDSLTFKPSLVHRIDRDTSGIIIIAKKKDILTKLASDFKNHTKIKKIYTCFVFGKMSRKEGTISKKLLRIENANGENKVQISDSGQTAITHYKVLSEYKIETKTSFEIISELEINIETGRMHQIRVHLSYLGNPIVGDKTYGNKSLNSYICKNFGLCRQALHASKIDFFHYGRNKNITLEARLNDDMIDFREKIKVKSS